ncbi:MAG: LiaI-LiaF-like domain-containing protein [Acidobacteriota bacterium]
MRCYYHADVESIHTCSTCRKFLCAACAHSIKGKIFCQDCLVAGAELAGIAVTPRLATYSPARAALFAIIPGIGAVYNRQYVKAVLHFAIFAGLSIIAGSGPDIFGVAAFAFYIFTIIDAYRSAQVILRNVVADPRMLEEESEDINVPIWGGVLVLLGVLFFLNNLGVFSLAEMTRFLWPLFFVGLGIYLVVDYYLSGRRRQQTGELQLPPARAAARIEDDSTNREERL